MRKLIRNIRTFFNFLVKCKNGYLVILDCFGLLKIKRPYLLKLWNGLRFYVHHWGAAGPINSIIFFNEYEILRKKSEKKECYIDIGAHIGAFSVYSASLNKNRSIYSFEPDNYNHSLLNKNIRINGLKNIKTFNKAVSGKSGTGFISISDEKGAQSHSLLRNVGKKRNVSVISLKDIFSNNKISHCNYLKIDCEGAEYSLLFNAPESIFRKTDKIFIEYHKIKGFNYGGIIKFFKKINLFKVKLIKVSKSRGHIIAVKK